MTPRDNGRVGEGHVEGPAIMHHGHRQQVRVRPTSLGVAPAQPRHGNAPAQEGQEQQEPAGSPWAMGHGPCMSWVPWA